MTELFARYFILHCHFLILHVCVCTRSCASVCKAFLEKIIHNSHLQAAYLMQSCFFPKEKIPWNSTGCRHRAPLLRALESRWPHGLSHPYLDSKTPPGDLQGLGHHRTQIVRRTSLNEQSLDLL